MVEADRGKRMRRGRVFQAFVVGLLAKRGGYVICGDHSPLGHDRFRGSLCRKRTGQLLAVLFDVAAHDKKP